MARGGNGGTIVGLLTLGVCLAALADPRFRKWCWSLLCRLQS